MARRWVPRVREHAVMFPDRYFGSVAEIASTETSTLSFRVAGSPSPAMTRRPMSFTPPTQSLWSRTVPPVWGPYSTISVVHLPRRFRRTVMRSA
jgi:hypothetical protein